VTSADVSVLMTVRNGARYLRSALESILEQTVPAAQIVVVDDGSTDDTAEILRSFGESLTAVSQPPQGISAATNEALRHVQHDLIAFLDADDLWEPNAIELRLTRLSQPDLPDAVGGATVQFVSPEIDPVTAARYHFDPAPVHGALFGSLIFRRELFERYGPLDETVPLAGAVDWMARAREGGIRVVWLDPVVLHRRIHVTNTSVVASEAKASVLLNIVRSHHRRMVQNRDPAAAPERPKDGP
jgi:glycosyltransferase involved in cell wall biosynthesis